MHECMITMNISFFFEDAHCTLWNYDLSIIWIILCMKDETTSKRWDKIQFILNYDLWHKDVDNNMNNFVYERWSN